RFFTDATNTRDVVRYVPYQALEIDGLDRLQAVAFADAVRRVENRLRYAALTGQNEDVLVDELQRVQIAGHDRAVQTLLAGLPRQGADDVVGLHPLDFVNRDPKGPHDVARQGKLRRELGWGGPASRLVLRQLFVTERPPAQIERRQHVVRVLLQRQQKHRREPIGCVDHPALPVSQRGEGEEGPVHERMPVD